MADVARVADGGAGPTSLRLDRFLWFARLTRTRGAAQALAASGAVRLDGRRILRVHSPVRIGSTLAFIDPKLDPELGRGAVRVVQVVRLPGRRGPPAEAATLYADLANAIDANGPRE